MLAAQEAPVRGVDVSSPVLLIALDVWLAGALCAALGGALGAFIIARITRVTVSSAKREAAQLLATAKAEGEAASKRIELEAEKRAGERRILLDKEVAEALS